MFAFDFKQGQKGCRHKDTTTFSRLFWELRSHFSGKTLDKTITFKLDSFFVIILICIFFQPLIYDIIQHASSEGIRRISFFDKTGFIKSKSEEIKDYWSKQISANQVYKSVVFPDKLTPKCPMGLSVHFLDLSDGKEQIVNITKEVGPFKVVLDNVVVIICLFTVTVTVYI